MNFLDGLGNAEDSHQQRGSFRGCPSGGGAMANISCARWGITPLSVSPHPGVGLVRPAGERRWRRESPGGASPSAFPVRAVETLLRRPRLRLFTSVGILSCSRAGTYDRRVRQEAGQQRPDKTVPAGFVGEGGVVAGDERQLASGLRPPDGGQQGVVVACLVSPCGCERRRCLCVLAGKGKMSCNRAEGAGGIAPGRRGTGACDQRAAERDGRARAAPGPPRDRGDRAAAAGEAGAWADRVGGR